MPQVLAAKCLISQEKDFAADRALQRIHPKNLRFFASHPMRLALYEPDIPQNAGTMMRMCACMNVPVDVIEPCGFTLSDRRFRRAGMDYLDHLDLTVHPSYDAFATSGPRLSGRLILLSTKAETEFHQVSFAPTDILMVGRESAGVPDEVHNAADLRVKIPMRDLPTLRSLNVAVSAAMVLGEALRQTAAFPATPNAHDPSTPDPTAHDPAARNQDTERQEASIGVSP